MESKQLFILGAPRSGTTFLASILADTSFGSPIETHFITKYFKKLERYGELCERSNFKKLIKDILAERPIQQWKLALDIDQFFDDLSPDYSYATIVHALMTRFRLADPDASWGDKTPHYLGDVEILLELFPNARFIYIVRDGRDVALSLLKKPWGPNNVVSCAEYWKILNSKELELSEIAKKSNLFSLTYEELLNNPTELIREIYQYLGEELPKSRIIKVQKNTKIGNKEKWRTELTIDQIRQFEAIAGNKLMELGYPVLTSSPKISLMERFYFKTHEFISKNIFLFHTNVIDGILIKLGKKEPFSD
ncbi:sulfotransferase [Marinobacter salinisoli]|uniref:Sulfotransferase n=1 Tax=Marinobacter salinisoli TaxID=2769486 RepID=A0ABX7MMT3_9GAMM|nr:sulfotransferase [Marinobacter salinisoli]QSP93526.1 sulfotransferase [Marinobacter salinisoli]